MRGWPLTFVLVAAGCLVEPAGRDSTHAGVVRGRPEPDLPGVLELVTPGGPCTASLVAPRVAVTAKHCAWWEGRPASAVGLELRSGPNAEVSEARVAAEFGPEGHAWGDDAADFLALVLDREPAIEPVPMRLAPLDATSVGRGVQFVGYGATRQTDESSKGVKRSGWTTIVALEDDPPVIVTAGSTSDPVGCFGDSGGPLLLDGTLVGVYVAFAEMTLPCAIGGRYLRLSAVAGYVEAASAAALGLEALSDDPCPECVDVGACPADYCVDADPEGFCDEGTRCRDDAGAPRACTADPDCRW